MSSDSSDDEDLTLLKEAQDSQFLSENLYSTEKGSQKLNVEKPVSLRKVKDENEQFNVLKVTPEFQKHVAKHLTLYLDKKLESELEYVVRDKVEQKKRKNGVKLFSNSKKLLKIEINEHPLQVLIKKPELDFRQKRGIEVKQEDLKNIAISGQDILAKKDITHWSKRSKSNKLLTYKKTKNGILELIE